MREIGQVISANRSRRLLCRADSGPPITGTKVVPGHHHFPGASALHIGLNDLLRKLPCSKREFKMSHRGEIL